MSPSIAKPKALYCPNCGPVELRGFAHALTVVCPQCLSVLDATTPEFAILQKFQGTQRIEPLIPLGSRGKFNNAEYEVIGFQERTAGSDSDAYSWYEYLLFNPYQGFRYLAEYNGHWNFIRMLNGLPSPAIVGKRSGVLYNGQRYARFSSAEAHTTYVVGEFPWRVKVGDAMVGDDFISPPYMLSSEVTDGEVTWSKGEYTTGQQVWEISDYMRPPIRLAAMMRLHVIHVFTHDSIAVGEDGATHQPIEQLAGLRAVPGLCVIRPADANETAVAWRVALEAADHPVVLVLTRQDVPTIDRGQFGAADGLRRGAYVLADALDGQPDIILIASGSEVGLVMAARQKLMEQNVQARVVSMPSWDLFDAEPQTWRDSVLLPSVRARLAVEAGATQGWHRYVGDGGDVLGIDHYGASAPGELVMREYGFSVENVCQRSLALVHERRYRDEVQEITDTSKQP